ncbi:outer membrane protein OprM precursor [mine drainage metagenome]|uniref:Outer membrane protein OprM n=1 Tax=mine drainage metagenome TaxID=410659 RepID=A0A1J5TBX6_9ZZZZ
MLDELIVEAMTSAPDLRTAKAQLRQARASRDLAVANLSPSIGVSASATPTAIGSAAGGGGTSQTLYAAGFDASWEPSIFGGLRDAAVGAKADAAASAATLESAQVTLVAEVALNYVTLRAYQLRLAIARDNVTSQSETLQITEWRTEAGLATSLAVEQARTNLEQSKASIPSLEIGRAEAEHRLALLTGQVPGALRERLLEAKPLPKAPDEMAVGIPADTIRQRPDVHAAELTLQAEIARTEQREAGRYPSLTLSGSWGWQSFSAAALGGSGSVISSLAGNLAATLFDGGRIRSQIAVQNAVQEQALIAYEKSILTALEDVENALAGYAAGRERVEARRLAAASARNAADMARIEYEAGTVDFQTVLDTERTRLTAEDGMASAEADLLTSVIALYKALGGGWSADGNYPEQRS